MPASGLPNILDRSLSRGKSEVAVSAFSFLFSEIVQHTRVSPTPAKALSTWESRLHNIGYGVGTRMLDLIVFRTKSIDSRETDLIRFLQFLQTTVWKALFGKQAEGLQKIPASADQPYDIYLITDSDPIVSHFVCNPPEYPNLSSTAYVAGILAGIADGAEFPAEVTAHNKGSGNSREIAYEIEFKKHVFLRHDKLSK